MSRNWAVLIGLFESKLYLKSCVGEDYIAFITSCAGLQYLEIMKVALSVYSTTIRINWERGEASQVDWQLSLLNYSKSQVLLFYRHFSCQKNWSRTLAHMDSLADGMSKAPVFALFVKWLSTKVYQISDTKEGYPEVSPGSRTAWSGMQLLYQ